MQILLSLVSPAINKSFDMLMPSNIKVAEMRQIILDNLFDVCDGIYRPNGDEILIHQQSLNILKDNLTLEQEGIKNGQTIYII